MAAFEKREYQVRLRNIKAKMAEKKLDILFSTNPANMNYISGYDGHSYYVPQGIAVFIRNQAFDASPGKQVKIYGRCDDIFGYANAQSRGFGGYGVIIKPYIRTARGRIAFQ